MSDDPEAQEKLKTRLETILFDSLIQICGNGLYTHLEGAAAEDETSPADSEDASWTVELKNVAQTTVSFPNKNSASLDGKPHNVEIRAPLALFHKCVGKKRKRVENAQPISVTAVSDLDVKRTIRSPLELAMLLCYTLEESLRNENLSHNVRPNASGIICLVTVERAKALRDDLGRLPCPQCVKWCRGEKGLWWHQQMEHGFEHSLAAASAASERDVLAIVPYNPQQAVLIGPSLQNGGCAPKAFQDETDNVFDYARRGNLKGLKLAIENGFDPRESLDRNGASLLLWAAGSGNLDIVTYLVEDCTCSPDRGQKGKRSFSGRTPLHWSARNGHLSVVQYLVDKCHVDIDATTSDGTTAFCWASWQGHLDVMKLLHQRGADAHKANSFGCTAVLWCAQGEGNVETMDWLHSIGLSLTTTNSNGHGALHKSAQRKRRDLCEWLCESVFENLDDANVNLFNNIGPDTEGCCPSDLAGMAGDDKLALFVAKQETRLARRLTTQVFSESNDIATKGSDSLPEWLRREDSLLAVVVNGSELNVWEPWGGVRRMQLTLR